MHTLIYGKKSKGKTTIARLLQNNDLGHAVIDDIGQHAGLYEGIISYRPGTYENNPVALNRKFLKKLGASPAAPLIFVCEKDITTDLKNRGIRITRTIHLS